MLSSKSRDKPMIQPMRERVRSGDGSQQREQDGCGGEIDENGEIEFERLDPRIQAEDLPVIEWKSGQAEEQQADVPPERERKPGTFAERVPEGADHAPSSLRRLSRSSR